MGFGIFVDEVLMAGLLLLSGLKMARHISRCRMARHGWTIGGR
jgi:hypothetical protein